MKKKRAKPTKRVKAGTSKEALALRRTKFRAEYVRNGGNGYQAAIFAGYKPGASAEKAAERLSGEVGFKEFIAAEAERAAKIVGLDRDRTLREVARLAYSNPRKLYDEQGNLKPIYELDEDTAAAVASIEQGEEFGEAGEGGKREVTGFTKKVKLWDKNSALEKAMKHHGLYEADNSQKPTPVELPAGVKSIRLDFGKVRARAKEASRRA